MTDRKFPLTKADEAVISRVQVSRSYYNGETEYELSPLDALDELVGQDNVLLDGRAIEVKRSPVYLTLAESDSGCRLMICDATASRFYHKVIGSDRVLLRIDNDHAETAKREMLVWSMSKEQIDLLRSLIRIPAVDRNGKAELIE